MTQLLPLYVALYSSALYLQSLSVYRVSEELGQSDDVTVKYLQTLPQWGG